jgi:hypothetical protein
MHVGRYEMRPHIQDTAYRGVQRYGGTRVHAIETETIWRRLAWCGVAVENAAGSRAPVNCDTCLKAMRRVGYAG